MKKVFLITIALVCLCGVITGCGNKEEVSNFDKYPSTGTFEQLSTMTAN